MISIHMGMRDYQIAGLAISGDSLIEMIRYGICSRPKPLNLLRFDLKVEARDCN
jgi:hypothetical protein